MSAEINELKRIPMYSMYMRGYSMISDEHPWFEIYGYALGPELLNGRRTQLLKAPNVKALCLTHDVNTLAKFGHDPDDRMVLS